MAISEDVAMTRQVALRVVAMWDAVASGDLPEQQETPDGGCAHVAATPFVDRKTGRLAIECAHCEKVWQPTAEEHGLWHSYLHSFGSMSGCRACAPHCEHRRQIVSVTAEWERRSCSRCAVLMKEIGRE